MRRAGNVGCLVSDTVAWVCQARGVQLLLGVVLGGRVQGMGDRGVMRDREIVGAQECIWGCGRPVLGVGGKA
jgi:hypothetical protein